MRQSFFQLLLIGHLLAGYNGFQFLESFFTASSKRRASLVQLHVSEKGASSKVSRRRFLDDSVAAGIMLVPNTAMASSDRRQIELCLVAVQRVLYWAEGQARALSITATDMEQRKKVYLESRLGAKAILTGKLLGSGGGVSGRIYTLASLNLSDCLKDLEWHARKQKNYQQVTQWKNSFREGLASIVEFDGMDTLIDPSPRATLTLAQYNDSKATYVKRSLEELVIPSGIQLVQAFGAEALEKALSYVQRYYADEIVQFDAPQNGLPR